MSSVSIALTKNKNKNIAEQIHFYITKKMRYVRNSQIHSTTYNITSNFTDVYFERLVIKIFVKRFAGIKAAHNELFWKVVQHRLQVQLTYPTVIVKPGLHTKFGRNRIVKR